MNTSNMYIYLLIVLACTGINEIHGMLFFIELKVATNYIFVADPPQSDSQILKITYN